MFYLFKHTKVNSKPPGAHLNHTSTFTLTGPRTEERAELFSRADVLVHTDMHAWGLHSPTNGKAEGSARNMPLLYMVKVTAKYMTRLPTTKRVFTAVQ